MENGLPSRTPSGLFPSGPPRPTYREPHPVRLGGVLAGIAVAVAWQLLFGLLASSVRGLVWLLIAASSCAWLAALVLVRYGDRGVAVGTALGACMGLTVAGILLVVGWATTGWFLW